MTKVKYVNFILNIETSANIVFAFKTNHSYRAGGLNFQIWLIMYFTQVCRFNDLIIKMQNAIGMQEILKCQRSKVIQGVFEWSW